FPDDPGDSRTWEACAALLPHVVVATAHARELDAAPLETAAVLERGGRYLAERFEHDRAETLLRQAAAVWEARRPESLELARTLDTMGYVLYCQARLGESRHVTERALALRQRMLPAD